MTFDSCIIMGYKLPFCMLYVLKVGRYRKYIDITGMDVFIRVHLIEVEIRSIDLHVLALCIQVS